MAQSARDASLESRSNRLKLRKGFRYWCRVGKGVALAYRRTGEGYGTWSARIANGDGTYALRALGAADDTLAADGDRVLTFFEAQDKAKAAFSERGKPAVKALTVAEASAHYLDWYRGHRKAIGHAERYLRLFVLPAFGDRTVASLEKAEIERWHRKIAATPARLRTRPGKAQRFAKRATDAEGLRARKATANRILTILKAMLNKAADDYPKRVGGGREWREAKPFEKVDKPRVRFLTAVEATRLANACEPDLRALVRAALLTGARFSELASLRVADFNADTAQLYLAPGKSDRARYVPLNAEGAALFASLAAGRPGEAPMLTKANGAAWRRDHHRDAFTAAQARAKISPACTFHDLRHTYASLLAQAGADLLTISKLLGHADTRITARHYAHLCDRTLALAVTTLLPGFGGTDTNVTAIKPAKRKATAA